MKQKTVLRILALSVAISLAVLACKKEGEQTTLRIHLTDEPADYEEVNIDLKEVNVKFDEGSSSWTTLNTRKGIYNLLDFQNGLDTVIAEGTFPAGTVKEVRFVLGPDNSIKINNDVFPLVIPSGSEAGLKVKLHKPFRGSLDSLTIDFNAFLSVKEEADGFKLRPVLQLK